MYRMGVSESKTVIVVCTLQQTLVSVSFCTRKCDVIEWAKLSSRPAPHPNVCQFLWCGGFKNINYNLQF